MASPQLSNTLALVIILLLPACTGSVRQATTDTIAEQVKQASMPDKHGVGLLAPELHDSQYRPLFFGYDTTDYRLAAVSGLSGKPDQTLLRLWIDVNYGGNVRHYDFAKFSDKTEYPINHYLHIAERCQLFNSLIASCLYHDQLSLDLTRSDLEKARYSGLKVFLASATLTYQQIELPTNYIQGFLKAIDK